MSYKSVAIIVFFMFSVIGCTKPVSPGSFYYYSANKKTIIYKYKSNGAGLLPLSYTVKEKVDADAKTFEYIKDRFARDKNHVFFRWVKLESVDPIPNVAPETFLILSIQ